MTGLARAGVMALGYVIAVLVGVAVAVVAVVLPTALPDNGAWGSLYRQDVSSIFLAGLVAAFPTALPGFFLAALAARHRKWQTWHAYSIAGVANVFPSYLLLAAFMKMLPADLPIGLLVTCLPGGFAGGFAYWTVAGRRLTDQWGGARG